MLDLFSQRFGDACYSAKDLVILVYVGWSGNLRPTCSSNIIKQFWEKLRKKIESLLKIEMKL